MRVFTAIGLPDAAADDLEQLQYDLPAGRAVPRENLHLTLSFLGDQDDTALEAAHDALSNIRLPAFDVQMAGLDFLGGNKPSLICANLLPNPGLTDLAAKVRSTLHGAGLMFERKKFRPHVTLARLPKRVDPGDQVRLQHYITRHAGFAPLSFAADHFALFRSDLHHSGAIYTELATYPLQLD